MINKQRIETVVLLVVALAVFGLGKAAVQKFAAPEAAFGAVGGLLIENYDPYVMSNGGINSALPFQTSSTLTVGGIINTGAFSSSATSTFTAPVIFDSSQLTSFTNATSSSVSAYVLTENDIAPGGKCYGTISFTKTGAVATTTLTFAASSTLANMIPNVGDSCKQILGAATSSEAFPGLTLAGSTGVQIGTSSTTPTGLTINGGQFGILTYIRKFNSDIAVELTVFKDAH